MMELISNWNKIMGEDAEAIAKAADRNMKMARDQKKQSQIQKTKATLTDQQKQLNDIKKLGGVI